MGLTINRTLFAVLAVASTLSVAANAQTSTSDGNAPFKAPSSESIYGLDSSSDISTPAFSMPDLNLAPGISAPRMPSIDENEKPSQSTSLTGPISDSPTAPEVQNTAVSGEKPTPWFRYMTLGPDLARELQESERKSLLPIVPTPPNLRATQNKRDTHYVLLRARDNERFGSFQTPYGQLFAKSGVIAFVATSQKVVRILNLNGREGQMLFRMNNGQLLCIGAGTEMTLAPDMENMTLNGQDGLARRGITRLPKDGPLRLAFSQFSFESFFELPEMKYFLTTQNKDYAESLQKVASRINEIRGVAGFRKAIDPTVIAKKPSLISLPKLTAKPVPSVVVATQQPAPPQNVKSPAGPGITDKLMALGRKASGQLAETKARIQTLDARTDEAKLSNKIASRNTSRGTVATTTTTITRRSPQVVNARVGSVATTQMAHRSQAAPAVMIAKQSSTDSSLSTEVRSKLFSAEVEERKVQKYRKQAKRSHEFVKGGFLTPEQSCKMSAEAKQFEINATLAQEKADKLRAEAVQLSAKSVPPAM